MPASPRWWRPSPPTPRTPPPPTRQSPLVIQQLRSAGVTSIIPLIPFNVFYPVLQAETAQKYFPKLLLSDYESSIESALGLLPVPYADALNGQEGVTTETLGGVDDDRPQSYTGGYDPGVRSCWTPGTRPIPRCLRATTDFLEEQGPIVRAGARSSRLFATAAKSPGPISTGAPSSPPCPRSPTSPAPIPPS
jgi:hypothetical protein